MLPKLNRTERKILLNQKIKQSEAELDEKLDQYKSVGKDALLIGGILVAAYAIMKLVSSENRKEDKGIKNEDSVVFSAIKGAALSFALGIAREKLLGIVDQMTNESSGVTE